jgi:hypothetical protein
MKDGAFDLVCRISYRTLMALGDKAAVKDAHMVFWAFREKIERAASDKYDRTKPGRIRNLEHQRRRL